MSKVKAVLALVLSIILSFSTILSGVVIANTDVQAPVLVGEITESETESSIEFSGKLDKPGLVDILVSGVKADGTIFINDSLIGSMKVTTSKDGTFTISIEKNLQDITLTENMKVLFEFWDESSVSHSEYIYTLSSSHTIDSEDENDSLGVAPEIKKIDVENGFAIYDTERIISGNVSQSSVVTAYLGNEVLGSTNVEGEDVPFRIVLKKHLAARSVITLQARDLVNSSLVSHVINLIVGEDTSDLKLDTTLEMKDTTTSVVGKVNKPATVQLFMDGVALNPKAVTTDAYGNFKISIKKQKAGKSIEVRMIDAAGTIKSETITVGDATYPVIEKIDTIYNSSPYITGKLSEKGTVMIEGLGSSISIDTDESGHFKTNQLDLKEKTKVKLTFKAKDVSGQVAEKEQVVTINADKQAPKLISHKVEIDEDDTTISGQISEKGKVVLVDSTGFPIFNNNQSVEVDTKEDGRFTINFPKQMAGSKIILLLIDSVNNQRKMAIQVKDVTKPEITHVDPIYHTSKRITGVVSEPSTITAYVGSVAVGKVKIKKVDSNGKYSFSLMLNNYPIAESEMTLEAVDDSDNKSHRDENVLEDENENLYVLSQELKITNKQTKVIGQLNKPGIVRLQLEDGTLLHKKPVQTKEDGRFTISIKKQEAGTKIKIVVQTPSGNTASLEPGKDTIVVEDVVLPIIKKVETLYETSNFIEGKISNKAEIVVQKYVDGNWEDIQFETADSDHVSEEAIQKIYTDEEGSFQFKLKEKLDISTLVRVKAKSLNGLEAKKEKELTVKEDKKAPKLVEPKKLVIYSWDEKTVIEGLLSEEGKINVLNDKTDLPVIAEKISTDAVGNFKIEIPKQAPGTKLVFEFEDTKLIEPNTSKKKVTVK